MHANLVALVINLACARLRTSVKLDWLPLLVIRGVPVPVKTIRSNISSVKSERLLFFFFNNIIDRLLTKAGIK